MADFRVKKKKKRWELHILYALFLLLPPHYFFLTIFMFILQVKLYEAIGE